MMSQVEDEPKFVVGDQVRVKHGVEDVNYPDMPLGGWAGTVIEVNDGGDTFTVRWSKEMLDAIHPVFNNRCQMDNLNVEEYRLPGEELEPDEGGPLSIVQPTKITARPLSPKDQDDRIRMVLGLTSDDLLPAVDDEMLLACRTHLAEHLSFPFEAKHTSETGPFSSRTVQVKVIGLGDLDEEPYYIDDTYGLLCDARIGRRKVVLPLGELGDIKETPNRQLVDDYCYWFWNWR